MRLSIRLVSLPIVVQFPRLVNCSTATAGNLGNILLIIIPAICKEKGSPFGDANACSTLGLSYVSYSMAVGAFYVWTYAIYLIRSAAVKYRAALIKPIDEEEEEPIKLHPNKDLEADDIHNSLFLQHQPTIEVKHSSRKWSSVWHFASTSRGAIVSSCGCCFLLISKNLVLSFLKIAKHSTLSC